MSATRTRIGATDRRQIRASVAALNAADPGERSRPQRGKSGRSSSRGGSVWQSRGVADGDAPPVESAYGRYLAPVANRWVNVAAAVAFIALGVFQLASGSFPFYLVLGLSWAVVAVWSWWMPVIVISEAGVSWPRQQTVPWAQFQELVLPPKDGWSRQIYLVTKDGRERALPAMNDRQLESVHRLTLGGGSSS